MRLRAPVRKVSSKAQGPSEEHEGESSSEESSGENYTGANPFGKTETRRTSARHRAAGCSPPTPTESAAGSKGLQEPGLDTSLASRFSSDGGQRRHQRTRITDPSTCCYLVSLRNSRLNFNLRLQEQNALLGPPRSAFTSEVGEWRRANALRPHLRRWLGSESIEFSILSTIANPYLEGMLKRPRGRPRKDAPKFEVPAIPLQPAEPEAQGPYTIPIFEARSFSFDLDNFEPKPQHQSLRVAELYEQVSSGGLPTGAGAADLPTYATTQALNVLLTARQLLAEGKRTAQILFCGGPVSAIQAAPRRLSDGDELVLISSFGDERMLCMNAPNEAACVQFWSFPSDLRREARLKFLLEIPNAGAILAIRWCPTSNSEDHLQQQQHELGPGTSHGSANPVLGHVAIATNTGRILIYCIPKDLDGMVAGIFGSEQARQSEDTTTRPVILSTKPVLELKHPEVAVVMPDEPLEDLKRQIAKSDSSKKKGLKKVKVENGAVEVEEGGEKASEATSNGQASPSPSLPNQQGETEGANEDDDEAGQGAARHSIVTIDNAPIVDLDWSPFANSSHIAAISLSGHLYVWDLTKGPSHPPSVHHFEQWRPILPASVSWFRPNIVCVTFRTKALRLVDIESGCTIFEDSGARIAGRMITNELVKVTTCPSVFPGLLSYDTSMVSAKTYTKCAPSDLSHTCSNYIIPPPQETTPSDASSTGDEQAQVATIPVFNHHQVQAFNSRICPLSGIVGSVGADGRLVHSLCGQMDPHLPAGDRPTFVATRTLLELVPQWKRRVKEEPGAGNERGRTKQILCYSHADCRQNKSLLIHIGDAANRDQVNGKKWSTKVPEACVDRRLESLTLLDFSKLNPALSIVGGESGLVFLIPSTL